MAKISKDLQRALLDDLADLGYGQADTEERARARGGFLPLPQHLRAFDPDVVLVVGERGTGKSALFKAVFEDGLLPDLISFAPKLRLPTSSGDRIAWIPGYPVGPRFPDPAGQKGAMRSQEQAANLWFACLVRELRQHVQSPELTDLFDAPGAKPETILKAFAEARNEPLAALDRLDGALQREDRWVFVGYDELDTLGGYDWATMATAIRGLVGCWATYARRWKRIRAKIFMRADLFRRHTGLAGADFAKLAANRVELTWSDAALFSMLVKRIANTSEGLFNYCKATRIPFRREAHPVLGRIPELGQAEDARGLIERMVGKYMGANPRKGQSFNWLLDHLRDAHGCATPRALVRLVEQAASKERGKPRATPPQLLHPTSLRQGLEDVSNSHVLQAIHNEWPWLAGVKERTARNRLVPWKRKELEEMLSVGWKQSWGEANGSLRPPTANAEELIAYLVELGVFRERSNDRIDVPDVYLFGLGLRRKGGVSTGRK